MTSLAGRRIELWVERRDGTAAVNPVMRALLEDLERAGAVCAVRTPESELIDVDDVEPDPSGLILLKSATALALSLALASEVAGATCLNGARATLAAHDKAATIARLHAAGLPVPRTLLAAGGATLDPGDGAAGAWISKPVRGVHGRGVTVHDQYPSKLGVDIRPASVPDDSVWLVQRYVGDDQPDTKVYVANRRCFVASKRFSPSSYASDGIERRALAGAEAGLVFAVGEALELCCFGVDLRHDDGQPVIIDANPFPGYRGFPDAVPALRVEVERTLPGR